MGNIMTLSELCKSFGISRRAIQGYEKHDLVHASGKNDRGYLLYDEEAQLRIKEIKLYQRFGFRIKEIKWLMDASDEEVRKALEERARHLQEEKRDMEEMIEKIYELIRELS